MHEFRPTPPPPDGLPLERPPENHSHLMIGKVASLYDITVQTLRHYDKIGLFCPEEINPETGYRYYSIEQLRQLEYILFLRRLRLTLPEIQDAMDRYRAGGDLYQTLAQRDRQLEVQIQELQQLRDMIHELQAIHSGSREPLNEISVQKFSPLRYLLVREIEPLDVVSPDFSLLLMENRKALLGTLPPIQTKYSFGATVSLADFQQSGKLRYTAVCLDPGPYGLGSAPPPGTQAFPAGFYATIRFRRSESRPEDAYLKLSAFLLDHYFKTGNVILETELDPSFSSISRLSDLVELQVQIHLNETCP